MVWGCCKQHTPVTAGKAAVLAAHVLFVSFSLSALYNALRDLVGLNLRRLRHWRDPALTLALSYCFALGAPQFDAPHVCIALSHVSSTKKCQTFLFVSVRFKLFRLFFCCLSFVFTSCLLVFSFVSSCSMFLACCGRCYDVCHGCRLFFGMFISYLLEVFDGLVMLPLVVACCNLFV